MTNRVHIRSVLADPESFATTLVTALVDVYGTEFLNWAPQTIRMETEDDFSFRWSRANFDRLMAGVALITSDSFYKSLPDFIDLCNVLSGSPLQPAVFDPADLLECAWGITEALLLAPPPPNIPEPFDNEIRAYIGKVADMEGVMILPDILKIGLRDYDPQIRVHTDFQDDPDMFAAIWGVEEEKTAEINTIVKGRLARLVEQLAALKLENGNTSDITKKLLAALHAKPEGGSPL